VCDIVRFGCVTVIADGGLLLNMYRYISGAATAVKSHCSVLFFQVVTNIGQSTVGMEEVYQSFVNKYVQSTLATLASSTAGCFKMHLSLRTNIANQHCSGRITLDGPILRCSVTVVVLPVWRVLTIVINSSSSDERESSAPYTRSTLCSCYGTKRVAEKRRAGLGLNLPVVQSPRHTSQKGCAHTIQTSQVPNAFC